MFVPECKGDMAPDRDETALEEKIPEGNFFCNRFKERHMNDLFGEGFHQCCCRA